LKLVVLNGPAQGIGHVEDDLPSQSLDWCKNILN